MGSDKGPVVVIGCGNGGMAISAWLSLKGHRVILSEFSEFRKNLKPIEEKGGIRLSGQIEGFASVEISSNIPDVVKNAKIAMAVIPAHIHARLANEIAPHLRDDAIVVLNPGRTGGALEVYRILKESGRELPVVEAQTLLFSCRKTDLSSVHIFGAKKRVAVGIMPASETQKVMDVIREIVPNFYPVSDIRTTSLGNIGAIFHPALAIVNASRIDAGVPFELYKEGATPCVGALVERMDEERINLAKATGAHVFTARQWLSESYGLRKNPIHEMLKENPAYQGIMSPTALNMRFIVEEIPTGLVPLEAFGNLYRVEMPTISSVITVANALLNADFRATGRTMESLGIQGMDPDQFNRYIQKGIRG